MIVEALIICAIVAFPLALLVAFGWLVYTAPLKTDPPLTDWEATAPLSDGALEAELHVAAACLESAARRIADLHPYEVDYEALRANVSEACGAARLTDLAYQDLWAAGLRR